MFFRVYSGAILTSTCLLYPNTSPVAIALFQLNLAGFLLKEPDMCFLAERERDVVIGRWSDVLSGCSSWIKQDVIRKEQAVVAST